MLADGSCSRRIEHVKRLVLSMLVAAGLGALASACDEGDDDTATATTSGSATSYTADTTAVVTTTPIVAVTNAPPASTSAGRR